VSLVQSVQVCYSIQLACMVPNMEDTCFRESGMSRLEMNLILLMETAVITEGA
jgi:hypothetical protein